MARYDAGWGRGAPGGYGGWQRTAGPLREQPGFGPRPGVAGRYDQVFEDFGGGGEGIYGPSRYGLGPYHQRLRNRRRSDEDLREEVEEALFYDTWVDAEAIQVQVKDGIVTLEGALPNYEEIRYATDDAWDVDGVVGVRSNLTVSRE